MRDPRNIRGMIRRQIYNADRYCDDRREYERLRAGNG
jgi:hypothetical protein